MEKIRKPAVSGMFYPSDKDQLSGMVDSFLTPQKIDGMPLALIVPHAGYIYSGAIAGMAYAALRNRKGKNILILGPAHRAYVDGIAAPGQDQFLTPFGNVPVNREILNILLELPFVHINDEAHREEHCIEVQLPFLQKIFQDFQIIPVLAGKVTPEEISLLLEKCEKKIDLIIISSDLSHYKSYERAKVLDKEISRSIENLDPVSIHSEQACGHKPIQGLLLHAKKRGLKVQTLVLKNSGDVKGDKTSVVGYGSFLFYRSA